MPDSKRTERSASGRPKRPGASDGRPVREERPKDARTSGWGGVARKGVGKLKPAGGRGSASDDWRKAMRESDERERNRYGGQRQTEPEEWIDEGVVRDEAKAAVERGATKPARKRPAKELPEEVKAEAARAAGPAWADRVQDRLRDAMRAYERERYQDARKLLVPLAQRAPGSLAVRELLGLTWYRMGRWKEAIKELEAVELLGGGTVEHHPVLMDCHRALKHGADVERLWEELRQGGPAVDVMIEGRIVLAGAMADRGDVRDAIALLEQGPVNVRKPKDHHLRLWYALGSMYERAGDVPRARQLFGRVLEADGDFADAAQRYDALT
jgi:tetratricopeptide (TPR) repeat protein